MVLKCCVKSCSSEFYPGCGISFFSFPKKDSVRQKWLEVVPFKLQENKNKKLVCGRHFKHTDIIFHLSQSRLNSEAVPSIFPNTKEWNQQVYHYKHKKLNSDEESVYDEIDELEDSNGFDKIMVVKPVLEDKRIEDIISTKSQIIKKPKLSDASTQTRHCTTRREEMLRIKIQTLRQTLHRRTKAFNRLRAILRLIKHKCKTYDEVRKVLSLKLSEDLPKNVI